LAPENFDPDLYGMKNWPENGVDLWRQFLEHVSWV